MRARISQHNPLYISKERYYELQHWCRQYSEWAEQLASLTYVKCQQYSYIPSEELPDKTRKIAHQMEYYHHNIDILRRAAESANHELREWVVLGVTKGYGYETLYGRGIPCSKDKYYKTLRKFFYILDKLRN